MWMVYYSSIVLFSVTQSATTKLFGKKSRHSLLFNSIKAGAALLFFSVLSLFFGVTLHLPTILYGTLYGVSLALSMYGGYQALCRGPMAITGMIVSFSVVIPLLYGLTLCGEKMTLFKGVGLGFLALAILFTNLKKGEKGQKGDGRWLGFVFLTFFCNGICSVLQKRHQTVYPKAYLHEFMISAMLFCFILFTIIALLRTPVKVLWQEKGKGYGVLSGAANGIANYLTLALAGLENASVLFPAISAGTILVTLACGFLLFHEKPRLTQLFAMVFGISAIVLLKI